ASLWQSCLFLLEELTSQQLQLDTIAASAAIHGAAGGSRDGWRWAGWLLDGMSTRAVASNTVTFNSVLTANEANWQRAVNFWRRMKGSAVDVVSCNAMINAWGKAGRWAASLSLLRWMGQSSLKADTISCSSVTSACASSWVWERASQLVQRKESSFSYNALHSACQGARQWRVSLCLLVRMNQRRVSADTVTCNAALTACQEAMHWQRCLRLLFSAAADTITFSAAVTACCEAANWQVAIQLFDLMNMASVGMNSVIFAELARACASGLQWEAMLSAVAEMGSAGYEPDSLVFASVVNALQESEQSIRFVEALMDLQTVSRRPIRRDGPRATGDKGSEEPMGGRSRERHRTVGRGGAPGEESSCGIRDVCAQRSCDDCSKSHSERRLDASAGRMRAELQRQLAAEDGQQADDADDHRAEADAAGGESSAMAQFRQLMEQMEMWGKTAADHIEEALLETTAAASNAERELQERPPPPELPQVGPPAPDGTLSALELELHFEDPPSSAPSVATAEEAAAFLAELAQQARAAALAQLEQRSIQEGEPSSVDLNGGPAEAGEAIERRIEAERLACGAPRVDGPLRATLAGDESGLQLLERQHQELMEQMQREEEERRKEEAPRRPLLARPAYQRVDVSRARSLDVGVKDDQFYSEERQAQRRESRRMRMEDKLSHVQEEEQRMKEDAGAPRPSVHAKQSSVGDWSEKINGRQPQDIIRMRHSIDERRRSYKEGRQRFMRGGNFSSSERPWAVRRFGEERERMKTEERKIKQLEDRLEYLLQRFRRHCR
ncbi:unnamed protein product, partial [Durusdinium trenchii]